MPPAKAWLLPIERWSKTGLAVLRKTVKKLVGPNLRFLARQQLFVLRRLGFIWSVRWNGMLVDAWVRDRIHRKQYKLIDEAQARARRKSDTVFIFGSGYSLNDISDAEWAHFATHDVLGLNAFHNQHWIPVDFHILRGGHYEELRWRPYANQVSGALRTNRAFSQTVFVMQGEFLAQFANQMIGYRLMPSSATILRYRTARAHGWPTSTLREGLRHQTGTLADAVNLAYCLGWTHIVLVGVDLYDQRYFYLPADTTSGGIDPDTTLEIPAEHNPIRGNRFDDPHPTVHNGVVDLMGSWRQWLESAGVRLSVYNPKSLLAGTLPVYERPRISRRDTT